MAEAMNNKPTTSAGIVLAVVIALSGTTVAFAQSQEGQQACMNDAFRLCLDAIPDRERVFQCLEFHKNLLSAACHADIVASSPGDQPPSKNQAPQAKSAKGKTIVAKTRF